MKIKFRSNHPILCLGSNNERYVKVTNILFNLFECKSVESMQNITRAFAFFSKLRDPFFIVLVNTQEHCLYHNMTEMLLTGMLP